KHTNQTAQRGLALGNASGIGIMPAEQRSASIKHRVARPLEEDKSMSYFITGGTGFVGRFLIDKLLQRTGTIYVLVRKPSLKKFEALRARWGESEKRVVPVIGDLAKPQLGVAPNEIAKMKGKVKHLFHLAAVYDLSADAESQEIANIAGTRHAVEFGDAVHAGCFHHVSSIAAAGM